MYTGTLYTYTDSIQADRNFCYEPGGRFAKLGTNPLSLPYWKNQFEPFIPPVRVICPIAPSFWCDGISDLVLITLSLIHTTLSTLVGIFIILMKVQMPAFGEKMWNVKPTRTQGHNLKKRNILRGCGQCISYYISTSSWTSQRKKSDGTNFINLISTIHLILLKMSKIKEGLPNG